MTIAITRNVPDRFNGFINSCMHEIAPGVYAVPKMKKSVRERLWRVLLGWEELIPEDGGVVLLWRSAKAPSGLGVRTLGWPKKELVEYEGMWLTLRSLLKSHDSDELENLKNSEEPPFDSDDPLMDQF
jgi:CRISPR-associated protein Cas2